MKNIAMITVALTLLFTVRTLAQAPAFAGNWKLKEKTLVSGKNFDNALAPFVSYTFTGDSVKVKKAGDPANVSIIYQTTERTYLPGKKQISVNEGKVTVKRYFNWLDGKKSWELVSWGSKAGQPDSQDYQFRDAWTYDAATDVLRVEMTFRSESEPDNYCTFRAVYERAK